MLLFCLPNAGGSARIYRRWAGALPTTVDIRPVELPGRGDRVDDLLHHRAEPLLDDLEARLATETHARARPYAMFGHSLGAILAFELARRMRSRGRPPAHLFLSGHGAPHLSPPGERIHTLPDAVLLQRIKKLGGTPEEVLADADLMRWLLPVLRADLTVSETYAYRPGPPLTCGITVYGGISDSEAPAHHLSAWSRHTTGVVAVRLFPGGHFFIDTAERALLTRLATELRQLDRTQTLPR
jgi:medium-chain acyl-[acyl-carrier-protein] hydrolase